MKTLLSALVATALAASFTLPLTFEANAVPVYVPQVNKDEVRPADAQQVHWRRHWHGGYRQSGWRGWNGRRGWGAPYGYYRRPYYPSYPSYYGYYGDQFYYPHHRRYYAPYRYYRPYGYYQPGLTIWFNF
jgi:hypothetical protein